MLRAVDADEPPLHLPLGERAYEPAESKFRSFPDTMEQRAPHAKATAFDT